MEQVDRDEVWRRRVIRLARCLDAGHEEQFVIRRCACGCRYFAMFNSELYPPDEPVRHDDRPLYEPSQRDGYWYACAVAGRDPERPATDGEMTPARRRTLEDACHVAGLVFGSVQIRGETPC